MREIKFRVWDKYRKRMFVLGKDTHDSIMFDYPSYRAGYYNLQCGDGGATTFEEDDEKHGFSPLMQYTGLKDKNGKEIYEGDILGGDYYVNGIAGNVEFYEELGAWLLVYADGGDEFLCKAISVSEVIGNIYEKLELLKA